MRLDMPIIETKRLLLRPIKEGDACDMFAYYQDPLVTQYLSFLPHDDVDQTLHTLRACYLPYLKKGEPQTWGIVFKQTDHVIGTIGFHSMVDDIAQVGYLLHQAYWNQGIMKEAMMELLRVGFTYTGLRRIEAYYETDHIASAMLLKACGFIEEGCMRAHTMLGDGKYHDMKIAAILKQDWKELDDEKNIRNEI